MRTWLSAILVALLCAGGTASTRAQEPEASYVLIAHLGVPTDRCDEKTVRRIFLGKKTRWEDGETVVPVMLRSGALHADFVEDLLDRTAARFETYWKQAVFTGRGIPPRAFDDERELLAYVAATPGAVGYVSRDTPRTGVKVIACN